MAHNVEPMDIDSDFDNKENSVQNSNVYPRTPCTEKGYEELDVSELNMKLRYSVTPAASPMSKSYTENCIDSKNFESDDILNGNLTRSFNSGLPKNDNLNKSVKSLPLQPISSEQFVDKSRNTSVLRSLDSTSSVNVGDVTITVSSANDNYEIPSSLSSAAHTPEAITPTKELPRTDGGSPIMRGLKSVLNMFRPSQSPIPPAESEGSVVKPVLSPADFIYDVDSSKQLSQAVLASTPIASQKVKEGVRRSSPLKESIVFNEDLEKELLWKDETTIFFKEEKIPIHKLFYPTPTGPIKCTTNEKSHIEENLNTTAEYMDISCNDSVVTDQIMTDIQSERHQIESDGEFVDCETTFTNDKSEVIDDKENFKIVMLENNYEAQINEIDSFQTVQQNDKTITVGNNKTSPSNTSEINVELSVAENMPANLLTKLESVVNSHPISINNTENPVPPADIYKVEEANASQYLNELENSQEGIEQFLNDQHTKIKTYKDCAMENLHEEPIKTNQDVQDSKPLDSLDIIHDTNVSENIPSSKEEFNEQKPMSPIMEDQRGTIEFYNILPANIPLPDDDNLEIEEPLKGNDATNIYIVNSKKETFDTELESIAQVDSVPNDLVTPAKDDENKVTCIEIYTKAISTDESESNFNDTLISTPKIENTSRKVFGIVQTVDDITQGIKTDIENIVRDAQIIDEENQKLHQVSENLQLKSNEHLDKETIALCIQNEEVINTVKLINDVYNNQTENETNTTESNKNHFDTTDTNKNELNFTVTDDNELKTNEILENDLIAIETSRKELKTNDDKINSTEINKNESNFTEINTTELNTTETKEIEMNTTHPKDIEFYTTETKEIELNTTQPKEIELNVTQTKDIEMKTTQTKEIEMNTSCHPKDIELNTTHPKDTELNITQTKVIEMNTTQTKDIESNTSQTKEIEMNTTHPKDIQLNSTHTKDIELNTTQPKEIEFNTTQTKDFEMETTQTKETEMNTTHPKDIELNTTHTKDIELNTRHPKDTELNITQTKVIEMNTTQNKDIESNTSQTKEIEMNTTHPMDIQLKSARTKDFELNTPEPKEIELNTTQTKDIELNTTQTKHIELNITQTKDIEMNTTQTKDIELNITQTKDIEKNITQTKDIELNITQTKDIEKNTTQTKDIELNITQTKDIEINTTQTKDIELNITQTKDIEMNTTQTKDIELNITQTKDIEMNTTQTKAIELNTTEAMDIDLNTTQNNDIELNTTPTNENTLITETFCPNEIIVDDFHRKDLQNIQTNGKIINDNLQIASNESKDPNKIENFENKPATVHIAASINDIDQITSNAKTDLMPDVIPDAKVCNAPILVESTENTADIKDNVKGIMPETTKVVLVENKSEEKDITINETPTNEVLFESKDELEINIDEEVILSESNSPFASIDHEIDQSHAQQIGLDECTYFASQSKTADSPPISPKISSKGYNFNFDEIDDPFATKTKIRLSPPPYSPEKDATDKVKQIPSHQKNNRRKSQTERKKSVTRKNEINRTFSGAVNSSNRKSPKPVSPVCSEAFDTKNKDSININSERADNIIPKITDVLQSKTSDHCKEPTVQVENKIVPENITTLQNEVENITEVVFTEENKITGESLTSSNEVKQTSSSEQSAYYSAETSAESTKTKNVFNIPEIDDRNFNPFITKSKVRESPPQSNDSFSDKQNSRQESCIANKAPESLEDNECGNISNLTCSSKTSDERDITVREVEVHTEDEDTLEGPFLETEDLNIDDKISDFDGEDVDMMQFSELPTQSNEQQLEDGEMFIDAEAFEFLLNQNKSNLVADSGKESLFLKFDPLFAKRVSTDGVLAALNKVQKRQCTPKKVPVAQQLDTTFEKPVPGPSNLNSYHKLNTTELVEVSSEDLNVTVSKPMMVVTPAVNPVTTRNKSLTPTSSNRRSITFSSPAIAVIDRLLSMSGNNSLLGHDNSMTQVSREQNEADHALTQLRELLAEKEIQVYNLRSESKELKDRLSTLESQMRALESDGEERLKKINDLNEKLCEKTKINKSMAAVVEEYERTIASLIAESEQDKKRRNEERIMLVKERDEQTAHLASMEVSFSDLHSKYEKSKQIILACKANEDAYKKSIKEFEENLSKMQSNYELLKQHATSKLNHANQELEKMNKSHESEVLKLNAMIKRKELHITSLEETLIQKTKANEELTTICDELISKVA